MGFASKTLPELTIMFLACILVGAVLAQTEKGSNFKIPPRTVESLENPYSSSGILPQNGVDFLFIKNASRGEKVLVSVTTNDDTYFTSSIGGEAGLYLWPVYSAITDNKSPHIHDCLVNSTRDLILKITPTRINLPKTEMNYNITSSHEITYATSWTFEGTINPQNSSVLRIVGVQEGDLLLFTVSQNSSVIFQYNLMDPDKNILSSFEVKAMGHCHVAQFSGDYYLELIYENVDSGSQPDALEYNIKSSHQISEALEQ